MTISLRAWRQCSISSLPGAAALGLWASFACAGEPAPGDAIANPVELQPLDRLSATRERPLFSSTRRPPPKPAVAPAARQEPPPPPAPPPSVVVLGIVSEDGVGRAAIKSAGDKVVRVRAGDDVGGWKVERVEPRRLVLTLGERSADFALFGAAAKGARSKALDRRLRQVRTVPPSD